MAMKRRGFPGSASGLCRISQDAVVPLPAERLTSNLQPEDVSLDLPRTVGLWIRPGEPRRIHSKNIFEYMDGAGELYLGYRFRHLDVFEYTAPGEDGILVELYWMASSDDAFGLLSWDWGGESVLRERSGAAGDESEFGGPRALYGAGLLRLWSDDLYARIIARRETDRSQKAVLALATTILVGRKTPAPPQLVGFLPAVAGPGFRLRADRICFFRSHLVLNSVYFLSTTNVLDLHLSVEAVAASYALAAAEECRHPAQLVLVRYPDAGSARKALRRFERIYLPDRRALPQHASSGSIRFWRIEDGWLGCAQKERDLALVFECPSRESASSFIHETLNHLDNREFAHE
jgi:hypothetical protein